VVSFDLHRRFGWKINSLFSGGMCQGSQLLDHCSNSHFSMGGGFQDRQH
jgi:hypothetical protein